MRKLIYGINITSDGCCDHTKGRGGDDIHQYFRALMQDTDTVIYGRKTYELMVPFWPEVARTQTMDNESNAFATVFANLKRVLVSRSLTTADDTQTIILRDNLKEEILRLKQQPGKNISTGGVDLPGQLIKMGLVDEFHIVVQPIIAGEGRRLFAELSLPESIGLTLISSEILSSGSIALRYSRADDNL